MCNCVSETTERVRQQKHAAVVGMEHFGAYYTEVHYVPFRKDGLPSKRRRYTCVLWSYCPFCGKQVKKEEKK